MRGDWYGLIDDKVRHRFFAKVKVNPETGCHEWTGARNSSGYGTFNIAGITCQAHRVAWVIAHGFIRDGMHILHDCSKRGCSVLDNRGCVNIAHLFEDTEEINQQDKVNKGRAKGAVGERNTKAKAEDIIALAIRAEYRPYVVTQKDLAKKYNLSVDTVHRIIHGHLWKHNYNRADVTLRGDRPPKPKIGCGARPGDRSPNHKLSEADVEYIRKAFEGLIPRSPEFVAMLKWLAVKYGVGVRCIRDIVNNRTRTMGNGPTE